MAKTRALALAAAAVGSILLFVNVGAALRRIPEPVWDHLPRRFREDVHIAEGLYLFGEFPVRANAVERWRDARSVRYREVRPHFARLTEATSVAPWQFWRSLPENRFRRTAERVLVNRYDDAGRPLLTGLGFKALGGIAPYLMFWLGPLLAVPVFAWIVLECSGLGRPLAGAALLLLLSAWPFFAEALALTYSTAGFYVLALVIAVPMVLWAFLHPQPRVGPLLLRALGAGVLLAPCVLARSGAMVVLVPLGIALAVGAWRVERRDPGSRLPVAGSLLAGIALVLLPLQASRMAMDALAGRTALAHGRPSLAPQRHELWFGVWTGLGDFDREKGHQWLDAAASAAVAAAGGTPLVDRASYDPRNEAIFRTLVLHDIRSDPAWYAGILARRLFATLAQRKLWPWPPLGGQSVAPARHANEGVIDSYYSLVTPADRMGRGGATFELPIPVLAAAPVVLLASTLRRRRGELARAPAAAATVAAGALILPVLVTTAGAIETQAFVLVYFLGVALLLDSVVRDRHPQGEQRSSVEQSR